MAIRLEFINLIIPIEVVNKYYPGGFKQYMLDNKHLVGGRIWYDDYLLRDGAMNPIDMEQIVNYWKNYGVTPLKIEGQTQSWDEVCVVEQLANGPTLPCDWIEVDNRDNSAFYKGKHKGSVVGREEMQTIS